MTFTPALALLLDLEDGDTSYPTGVLLEGDTTFVAFG
jgi:hypothetical protein